MTPDARNITQSSLWKQAWDQILTAAAGQTTAFATPVVGNCSDNDSRSRLRTVVLRKADGQRHCLYCYTDRRSVKARQLQEQEVLTWLFWDSDTGLQFTGSGPTHWLTRQQANALFADLPKHSRKAYATLSPPSTHLQHASSGLPLDWDERSLAETDYARQNFGVLVTELDQAEILKLDRKGNLRLLASRNGAEWDLQWVVP